MGMKFIKIYDKRHIPHFSRDIIVTVKVCEISHKIDE